jgi:hypothetical protein
VRHSSFQEHRRFKTKQHGTKVLLGQATRGCFHPGTSSLSRESFTQGMDKSSQVTSKDMLKAMLSYIWPKVCPFLSN